MVNKKGRIIAVTGTVFNLGSQKKNIASTRRKLKRSRFKGMFKIKVGKTPKTKGGFVKFKARRK